MVIVVLTMPVMRNLVPGDVDAIVVMNVMRCDHVGEAHSTFSDHARGPHLSASPGLLAPSGVALGTSPVLEALAPLGASGACEWVAASPEALATPGARVASTAGTPSSVRVLLRRLKRRIHLRCARH